MPVFDIETDNLLEDATRIHVLSYSTSDGVKSITDYDEMREWFLYQDILIGHNIYRFDIPVVEKLLGIKVSAKIVDTLALSWYLNFDRQRHGLEWYGEDYGIPKPKVSDWNDQPIEVYIHRCEEDVKINLRLWNDLQRKLRILYPEDSDYDRFLNYLMFKMECAAEQERIGWRLDVAKAQGHYEELLAFKTEKEQELIRAMPKVPVYKEHNKPKVMFKKDGSLSSHGKTWLNKLIEAKLPHDTKGPINLLEGYEDGNPNSSQQVKDWLYGLGWKPQTFKYVKENDGTERAIPQVNDEGELCESVKELSSKDPAIELLEGLSVINHRLAIFKSFLDCERNGYVKAQINGLTNTMRFKHSKPLVNLPGVHQAWGKEIRGCLIAPDDDHVLVGTDMVSLEDNTKRHYMQPLDPKYVEEMSQEGFDPHLNLALFAGVVTQAQIDQHNKGEISLKDIRKKYKAANYSCIYGVGAAKLARSLSISKKEAEQLIEAYWKRNWAIKKVSEQQKIKITGPYMWLQNPVSGFWHNLRAEKDAFSTLNQSTGVFCFDTWVAFCRKAGLQNCGQFHDETISPVEKGKEEWAMDVQKQAIAKTNMKLKLNVQLDVSPQFGSTYAEIH